MIKFLKYPIVRHLVAGVAIVGMLYAFSIAPLQQQNKALRKDLKSISDKQLELVGKLAEKDTYKIDNNIDDAKIKKGGEIKLIPDNTMIINSKDSVRTDSVVKQRGWISRTWHKIGNLFR